MLYLLCALLATFLMAFAQSWAACYAFILQQGATPNSGSLWRAAWQTLQRPDYWARFGVWPHSVWQRGCAVLGVSVGVFLATALLHKGWQSVTHGHVSIVVSLWIAVLTVVLLFLAWCDLYTRLLPDALTIPLMIVPWWVNIDGSIAMSTPDVAWWWGVALYIAYRYGLPLAHQRWMGAGDFKLYLGLWAASPQPGAGIGLVLVSTCACWVVQAGWQQRCLPRGACAFGPYLCLAYSVINVWESSLSMGFSPYGF